MNSKTEKKNGNDQARVTGSKYLSVDQCNVCFRSESASILQIVAVIRL